MIYSYTEIHSDAQGRLLQFTVAHKDILEARRSVHRWVRRYFKKSLREPGEMK